MVPETGTDIWVKMGDTQLMPVASTGTFQINECTECIRVSTALDRWIQIGEGEGSIWIDWDSIS